VWIPKNHLVSNCAIEGIVRHNFRINYAGIDLKTNEHKVRVGCQVHSISRWKDAEVRKRIMSRHSFQKEYEQEFLEILAEIEKKYVLDPFKKIEENIQKLKENVSEELKTETISLISSLPVIQAVQKSGPKRDKFGRFA
jgi:CRISPR/Cas system-associated exonuclease Cas4 (RecB family)